MTSFILTDHQLALINRPIESKTFLEGPAGTGKTTAGVGRLLHPLDSRVRARSILVLVPQRTLATPYYPSDDIGHDVEEQFRRVRKLLKEYRSNHPHRSDLTVEALRIQSGMKGLDYDAEFLKDVADACCGAEL